MIPNSTTVLLAIFLCGMLGCGDDSDTGSSDSDTTSESAGGTDATGTAGTVDPADAGAGGNGAEVTAPVAGSTVMLTELSAEIQATIAEVIGSNTPIATVVYPEATGLTYEVQVVLDGAETYVLVAEDGTLISILREVYSGAIDGVDSAPAPAAVKVTVEANLEGFALIYLYETTEGDDFFYTAYGVLDLGDYVIVTVEEDGTLIGVER